MQGVISYIHPEKPFGFLKAEDGSSVFFHRNSCVEFVFGPDLKGQQCEFDFELTPKGPAATEVRPCS